MKSDDKIIQGLIEAADDSPEWWAAWQEVGRYFRKHWARQRKLRQLLANTLVLVAETKRGQHVG